MCACVHVCVCTYMFVFFSFSFTCSCRQCLLVEECFVALVPVFFEIILHISCYVTWAKEDALNIITFVD